MQDFFDVLQSRRTIRSYTAQPLAEEDLLELVNFAILAPTGMNAQPWSFTLVSDRTAMQRLNAIVVEMLHSPQILALLPAEGISGVLDNPDFDIFYGAPALVVIKGDMKAPSAAIDCQLAAQNLFLAAHARGFGTCYMGFLQMAAGNPEVQRILRVSEGQRILAAAVVGHPDQRPDGPPQRRPAQIEWVR